MGWIRGEKIGHGSFGQVNLAVSTSHNYPCLMAVKSCSVSLAATLINEKYILNKMSKCPNIIHCFGHDVTLENEYEVERYTKNILKGLCYIHKKGYVHCDIKHQNVLLVEAGGNYVAKIADLGLAKRAGNARPKCDLRGTIMYMSPEMVTSGEQESAADVWALGCLVLEMITATPAWKCRRQSDFRGLMMRIGVGDEVPEIPDKLSKQGKDFLGKCFLKNPRERWTAEMLLNHPFIASYNETLDVSCTSPTSALNFPHWLSAQTSLSRLEFVPEFISGDEFDWNLRSSSAILPENRIHQLVTDYQGFDWSNSGGWVTIRGVNESTYS
ncbi:putative serine/threonine-protein kinase Rad53 [Heracleum sosnowskyi]|uniref:Serine/threonine-protein kinase Rad53 n=1 Tax=Heracleum sosnowskyi TaxID=360622 RepID=A0AAD8HCK6_9APIA|nr:putative serine/threonine-protein kinase Rad53 [Heracleum sosnowskyi]